MEQLLRRGSAMGGLGSGRSKYSTQPTTEQALALDVRVLERDGSLRHCRCSRLTWDSGDRTIASIDVACWHRFLLFLFEAAFPSDEIQSVRQLIQLEWKTCGFSNRALFRCPTCPAASRVLYLSPTTARWACRRCIGLVYASTREQPYDRLQRRANHLRERLGCPDGYGAMLPEKPKGMHWSTYEWIVRDIERLDRPAFEREAYLREEVYRRTGCIVF
jgi:hypothetical protein